MLPSLDSANEGVDDAQNELRRPVPACADWVVCVQVFVLGQHSVHFVGTVPRAVEVEVAGRKMQKLTHTGWNVHKKAVFGW